MVPGQIEMIVAVNDSLRRTQWYATRKELRGTVGRYHIRLACHYKKVNGKIMKYPILCPYVRGFDLTF